MLPHRCPTISWGNGSPTLTIYQYCIITVHIDIKFVAWQQLLYSKLLRSLVQCMVSMRFRDPQALSSTLALCRMLQPWTFRSLNQVDPLDSASNYYISACIAYWFTLLSSGVISRWCFLDQRLTSQRVCSISWDVPAMSWQRCPTVFTNE